MKRTVIYSFTFIFILSFFRGGFFYFPNVSYAQSSVSKKYMPLEILVKLRFSKDIVRVAFTQDVDLEEVILDYKNNKDVEYVEYNYIYQASAFPNDPEYSKQWYLNAISAREAWSRELLAKEFYVKEGKKEKIPIIAVLDTGVDIDHPDLSVNIWQNILEREDGRDNDRNGYIDDIQGWDFIEERPDPRPKFIEGYTEFGIHHGTVISGIAAAVSNNFNGVSGISWNAKIMPLRVLDSQGNGNVYSVIKALDYAVRNGADVVNMSFVGEDFSQILFDKIKSASDDGVMIIAAAGNNDPDSPGLNMDKKRYYPVCFDADSLDNFIIGVASIDQAFHKSEFSHFGTHCVDISAPGESFYTLQVYRKEKPEFSKLYDGYWSGTSVATPIVSAAAATVISLRPDLSRSQVANILIQSVDDISKENPEYIKTLGAGKINLYKAVENTLATGFGSIPDTDVKKKYRILTALGHGSFPQIKIFNPDFTLFKAFFAYAPNFSGSILVQPIDIDNNGKYEIMTGTGPGGGPHVRIFNQEGQAMKQFFAFDKKLRNGVNIASGDVDGDGDVEVVVGAPRNQKPEIRVFTPDGELLSNFFAYSEGFRGGVNVAVADINNDGEAEIITGAGFGGGPHVRVFDNHGRLRGQFFPYDKKLRSGVNIAVGDLNNDGNIEIVTSPQKGEKSLIKIFSAQEFSFIREFIAYEPQFLDGINVAIGDYDNDGAIEIITGTGAGGTPKVRIFDSQGKQENEFFAYSENYRGGVRVGVIK